MVDIRIVNSEDELEFKLYKSKLDLQIDWNIQATFVQYSRWMFVDFRFSISWPVYVNSEEIL